MTAQIDHSSPFGFHAHLHEFHRSHLRQGAVSLENSTTQVRNPGFSLDGCGGLRWSPRITDGLLRIDAVDVSSGEWSIMSD